MSEWLAVNWFEVLVIVAMASVAHYRLTQLEKKQDEHLRQDNNSPHPACPVHSAQFLDLIKALSKIESRLEILDSRIYDFMRSNGYINKD